jgi:hypothetical protein
MATPEDRARLKYVVKVFFIMGTGHNIDGIEVAEFAPLVSACDNIYGKQRLQPLFEEAINAGRDPLTAAGQNLYPPGIAGLVNPNNYTSLDNNIDLVMQRYGL